VLVRGEIFLIKHGSAAPPVSILSVSPRLLKSCPTRANGLEAKIFLALLHECV
jgi:hypothetical protein